MNRRISERVWPLFDVWYVSSIPMTRGSNLMYASRVLSMSLMLFTVFTFTGPISYFSKLHPANILASSPFPFAQTLPLPLLSLASPPRAGGCGIECVKSTWKSSPVHWTT